MSDKEVRIRITGDVSDLEKKLKSIESSLKDLGKSNTGNNKFVNSLIDDIGKADKKIDELGDSLDNMSDSFRQAGKSNSLDDMVSDISKVNKELTVTTAIWIPVCLLKSLNPFSSWIFEFVDIILEKSFTKPVGLPGLV